MEQDILSYVQSMFGIMIPFTLMTTGSDNNVNLPLVALQKYKPLFDCCIGLNCSWLVVEVELTVTEPLLITSVLPSGGPFSH